MSTRHSWWSIVRCIAMIALFSVDGSMSSAIEIDLKPPGEREFIRDLADMLDSRDEEHIRKLCDSLLTDKATPIIVITIESMAKHGGSDMRIETFATLLFDQWGISSFLKFLSVFSVECVLRVTSLAGLKKLESN